MAEVDALGLEQDVDTLSIVISEARDHLEMIEGKILALEETPDDVELINDIFRPIHSIKGNAGFIGFGLLNTLSHETETLLDQARKKRLTINPDIINILLEAVDGLKSLVGLLAEYLQSRIDDTPMPDMAYDIGPISRKLDAAMQGRLSGPAAKAAVDVAAVEEETQVGKILVEDGVATEEQVEHAAEVQHRPIGKILVERGAAESEEVERVAARQTRKPIQRQEGLKVNLERLDTLIDLVGELSIAQTMLVTQRATGATGDAFDKVLDQFGKLTEDIQDRAMAMRMVPIKPLFQKMQRLVRDLGRKSGKDVALRVRGEETEIDKTVVEELGDPLVHLVRNAMDHGLESPADREAAGKPASGEVRLEAYHAAGHIVIELADDGRGIDGARVRAKAEERGLVEPGATLSESQTHQLLFLPGFSTATQVTELSGRGVGMDVVKRNIERLRGRVDVQSVAGQGTTFTIKLPLTLAIIDGMIVQVGREQYVIPLVNIVQSVRPQRAQVQTVQGRGEYVQVRGELVPLVRLHTVFGTGGTMPAPWEALVVVVMTEDGRQGALVVDELLGQQQVVVKTLGPAFRQVRGLSGASIMGDGQVALILDVTTLLDYARAA